MKDLNVKLGIVAALVSFGVATACGDDESEPPAGTGGSGNTGGGAATGGSKGGSTSTGGTVGAGGGPVGTGGTTSTGGTTATGGSSTTGGAAATGGASSSGGATGSGGAAGNARCEVYCDEQQAKCGYGTAAPANFADETACLSGCNSTLASKPGTQGTATGDTLECRIAHLGYLTASSSAGDKTLHCGHAKLEPTAPCAN